MKDSAFSERKTWRNFTRRDARDLLVRRLCCAVLVLEAAWLLQQRAGDFFALRMESVSRQWLSPVGDESGESFPEEIFGFRLRLRDGAVEFYHQEETVEGTNPGDGV